MSDRALLSEPGLGVGIKVFQNAHQKISGKEVQKNKIKCDVSGAAEILKVCKGNRLFTD